MVNRIGPIYSSGLNKGLSLRFCVGYWVWHEITEVGRRTCRPKFCEYNNKDKDNSPTILSDKNYQTPSQKFSQIIIHLT